MADGDVITAQDLERLTSRLDDLADAFEDLRSARTPADKQDARDDVAEARESLEAMARRLGVSKATLEKSVKAAKDEDRKSELRPILRELLDEMAGESGDPDDDEPDDDEPDDDDPPVPKAKAKAKQEPAEPKAKPEPKPKPDTEPVKPHWSEAGIGGFLR